MAAWHIAFFDESYTYKGYALVNEIYEDEDHRANTWMWGRLEGLDQSIVDARALTGLSSNSYASFEEAYRIFKSMVNDIQAEVT